MSKLLQKATAFYICLSYRFLELFCPWRGMNVTITSTVSLEMERRFSSISYRSLKDTHGVLSPQKIGVHRHILCLQTHKEL